MSECLKIDLVIPVHNALGHFRDMVSSLWRYTERERFRLIIVDDACDNETKQFITQVNPDVRVVHSTQQWYTRAVNSGLDMTKHEIIAVLNTDILLCEGWLAGLLRYFDEERVMLAGSDHQPPRTDPSFPTPPDYLTGHCWLVRRRFLEEHGTLDENNAHIDSDRLFSYRVCEKGFRVARDHALPIIHGTGPSWGRNIGVLPKKESLAAPRNRKLEPIGR
jgi:GT2 family glycosyltransferase